MTIFKMFQILCCLYCLSFLNPTFVGTLLHILVNCCHLFTSGVVWNHWQECLLCHACARDKQRPLIENLFHSATRGKRKLRREPLKSATSVKNRKKNIWKNNFQIYSFSQTASTIMAISIIPISSIRYINTDIIIRCWRRCPKRYLVLVLWKCFCDF